MTALQDLVELLQVKVLGEGHFVGDSGPGSPRIYGGLTVTQALDAARHSCPAEFAIQSIHGQFLRPGDHDHPIDIEVKDLKDGRRFKLYNVYCRQQGKTIFFATVTFHKPEPGCEHSMEPPELTLPEADTAHFYPHRQQRYKGDDPAQGAALEVRIAEMLHFEREQEPENVVWFRAASELPMTDWQQILLLAYASDWNLPSAAMRPHTLEKGYWPNLASLDHAIWFYRQPRFDDWVSYVQQSPAALNGRGHTRALFYSPTGELLACVNQESYLVAEKLPEKS